jgi:hypothetical protein
MSNIKPSNAPITTNIKPFNTPNISTQPSPPSPSLPSSPSSPPSPPSPQSGNSNKGNSTQINNLLAKLRSNQPSNQTPQSNTKTNMKQSNNQLFKLNNKNNLSSNDIKNINTLTGLNNKDILKMTNKELENSLAKLNNETKKLENSNINKKKNEKELNKKSSEKEETNKKNTNKESQNSNRKNNIVKNIEPEGESKLSYFLKFVVVIAVVVALIYLIKYLITRYELSKYNKTNLLKNSKNAKYPLVISQDPTSVNYTPIKRSEDRDGAQFTYGFWFLIDNFDYKKGEWKHVFHKGNDTSFPNRAPGVWFHPDKNAIRVYMNTQDNITEEYVDIENIPIRKWVYMNIILNQNTNKTEDVDDATLQLNGTANLDIYINGSLKVRKLLNSLPKQNDGDFWINMFGGFEGYLSNIIYYPFAINYSEINNIISEGPSKNNCIDTKEIPPYLDDNWWYNNTKLN